MGFCKDSQAKKNILTSGNREAVMAGETPYLQHQTHVIIIPNL